MKIVIDIEEDLFEDCKRWVKQGIADDMETMLANGTPLPKGHGDLIDRSSIAFNSWSVEGYTCVCKKDILNIPVIVPADKEGD